MAKEADAQARDRPAALRFRLRQARPAAERPAVRSADLHDLHRQRGRPQARPQHARRDRRDRRGAARVPDHPRPLEHLVRPQPAGAAGAELGVSRPRAAARPDRRDRACLEDPAAAPHPRSRGAGRRGSDLRPPPRRATTRCRPSSRCSRTARPRRPRRRAAPEKRRGAPRAAHRRRRPARASKTISTLAMQSYTPLDIINDHPARRHEDGRRAVRRRQDAASLRAAIGRDDEGGGRLPRAATWSGSRARKRARSCSRRCAATCTTSARTSSTSSSPTTATRSSISASSSRSAAILDAAAGAPAPMRSACRACWSNRPS